MQSFLIKKRDFNILNIFFYPKKKPMKKIPHIVAILFAVCAIYSCQKIQPEPLATTIPETLATTTAKQAATTNPPSQSLRGGGASNGCPPTIVNLLAGQTINSGTVTVSNDSNFVYVTYTTINDWRLTQTHLYVGDCALIPVNNPGNPIPGQFPYKGTHDKVTEVNYQIPISVFGANTCVCVAAHAVVVRVNGANQVVQTETGWGEGTLINLSGGNWGMKFNYCACTL